GFEILQHRRLVCADFFRARHALIDRDRQLDPELRGDGFRLAHGLADHARRFRMPHELFERAPGQRADRVERYVPQELHPDLVAEASGNWTAKPGADQDLRERSRPLAPGAVGLAEAEAIAFG